MRCIIAMRAGCRLRTLYVKGIIMMIAAGGALSDNLDSLLIKEANNDAGRCLQLDVRRNGIAQASVNVRGAKEKLCQSEESCSVLEMQQIPIEIRVETVVEARVVPADVMIGLISLVRIFVDMKRYAQIVVAHKDKQTVQCEKTNTSS